MTGIARWTKRGRLLAPEYLEGARVTPWLASHAAVPILDPLESGLHTLYFSTRDAANRSHTARVTVDLRSWPAQVYSRPELVLAPGELGTFDDSGAMGSWLVTTGGRKFLYYIGWNLAVTVPFRNAIGVAVSDDGGRTFVRYAKGPVLDRSTIDPFFTASAAVLVDNGIWRMWYLSCVGWERSAAGPRHRYHIKYAESANGIDWRRTDVVAIDFAGPDEYAISRPCVLIADGGYQMWYSYRGERYHIGYAESVDGLRWERHDERAGIAPGPEPWDDDMIEYPFVFDYRNGRVMLYNGNGYGATGIGWATLNLEVAADVPRA